MAFYNSLFSKRILILTVIISNVLRKIYDIINFRKPIIILYYTI